VSDIYFAPLPGPCLSVSSCALLLSVCISIYEEILSFSVFTDQFQTGKDLCQSSKLTGASQAFLWMNILWTYEFPIREVLQVVFKSS
jgi:hypothetical protein